MTMNSAILSKITFFGFCGLLVVACAHAQQPISDMQSGPEAARILFKAGKPSAGESLSSAVSDLVSAEDALQRDRKIILSNDAIRYAVVGFTDGSECKASDCVSLSFRRAKLVNDWLIAHGVPQKSLKNPEAKGNEIPVGFQSTAEERFISRHATIVYVE